MSKIIPVNITTTEQAVTLDATYQFAWLWNSGENDCLFSNHSGIVQGDDDVTLVAAGDVRMISTAGRAVYIKAVSGTSTGEIHAQNFAASPFKRKAKGGESITVTALNVTENDTYTAPSGTAYSPVSVNVPPSGVEIIDETDWDNMTTAQKQAKGVVAIRQFNSGYDRGVLVNGADYPPMPVIMSAQSRNGSSAGYLQYQIPQGGKYQILGIRKPEGSLLEDVTISLNNTAQTTRYITSANFPLGNLEIYICEVTASTGDTIKVSNSIGNNSSGLQMFVMKNVEVENVAVYNTQGNGASAGFLIDTTLPYLHVSHFGYYNSNNVFEFYEVDHVVKTSEYCNSDGKYWYGGTYVLTLQGSSS